MSRPRPRTLKGFQDYLPDRMIPRSRYISKVRRVFENYGFVPLETPALELSELLLHRGGDEVAKQVFRFEDAGGRDVCMRYDFTVPLARVVAQYPRELPRPFKRYQIGPVWRGEKPQKGRFREFYQCDADVVGTDSLMADAECLRLGVDLMGAMGVEPFRIRVNHRGILDALAARLDVKGELAGAVLRAIDKLDKIGVDAVIGEVAKVSARAEDVRDYLSIAVGPPMERMGALARFLGEGGRSPLEELEEVVALALEQGVSLDSLEVDGTVARGMGYYTGTIFETRAERMPELGSVMSGGRYDGLVGTFSKENVSGVGISLGLDRTIDGLFARDDGPKTLSTAQVLVTLFDADSRRAAFDAAARLREAGIPVEVPYEVVALKKQIRSAHRRGIPHIMVQGPDERERGTWKLKELESGIERELSWEALLAALESWKEH